MADSSSIVAHLLVNGRSHHLTLDTRTTLLDALRVVLGLTGTKNGCDRGQCGACTVLADGRRIYACLTFAAAQQGVEIITIEGLAADDSLHPMQRSFLANDALQCGYCTPGQICSGVAMLVEVAAGWPSAVTDTDGPARVSLNPAEIRERMSGNLCRCGAYVNIVAAIEAAAGDMANGTQR